MKKEQIFNKVITLISERFRIEEEECVGVISLRKDLKADCFDNMMVILDLEEKFEVEIDESDFEGVETIDDIVNLIKRKQKQLKKK